MAKETVAEPAEPTMASVMARLADIAAANQITQKEQVRQTRRRSNPSGPDRSPFNPRGNKDFPLAPLKCEIWYQFKMTAEQHALDREEVELMNLIEPGEYTIEMNDGAPQLVCIVGMKNAITGGWDRLSFKGPKDEDGNYTGLFTQDRRGRFPSTRNILRQILGSRAQAVMTMPEELRRISLPDDDPARLPISLGE